MRQLQEHVMAPSREHAHSQFKSAEQHQHRQQFFLFLFGYVRHHLCMKVAATMIQ